MSLTLLVNYTPIILILGGITSISWLLAFLFQAIPIVGTLMNKILRALSVLGFVVGIILLITGFAIWSEQVWDIGTNYLLIITGLALVLKPIKQITWAALVGFIIGASSVIIVYFYFPLPEILFGISSIWIYLAIFFIPALITYVFFKFLEDLIKIMGIILASRPVVTILGFFCIVQGILLLFNQSIFPIIFGI